MKSNSYKRILVVAESIDINDSSGSKANVALIENLVKAGFEVVVYHYTRKEIQLNKICCISIKEDRSSLLFFLSRLQRRIQHGLNSNLAKYLEPIFGFSFTFFNDAKSISKALKQEKVSNYDLVLSLSKGASFRPHYALLQVPGLHDKWLVYIHDPYPFHFYPEPYQWSEPGFKQKIQFFEEMAVKCKWAGYPSLLLGEWMEAHYKGLRNKRIVLPHQLNERGNVSAGVPSWFDEKKFNLLHAGNLMKQRDPFPLIEAFEKFLFQNPQARADARLILVGNADYHNVKLHRKEQDINELFISEGYLEYDVVLELQKTASVNIILESVSERSPFLPGKFPHCVAANKAILHLGPEKSEVSRLLGEDYAFQANADDVEKIVEIIEKLYFNWTSNTEDVKLNRPELEKYLSEDFLKVQMESIL